MRLVDKVQDTAPKVLIRRRLHMRGELPLRELPITSCVARRKSAPLLLCVVLICPVVLICVAAPGLAHTARCGRAMRRRPGENGLQVVAVTGRNGPQEERVVVELRAAPFHASRRWLCMLVAACSMLARVLA